MSSTSFPALLLEISDQISEEQLDKLRFLVREVVGKRELERVRSGRDLFRLLTERGRLSADRTDYLALLLTQVQRNDLSERLHGPQGPQGPHSPQSPQRSTEGPEEAKLDVAMEIISESLGKSWRRLGRRLGVMEVKLESIAQRHPTDLEETAMELLKEWRRSKGGEARTDQLIQALRSCHFNMTADKLEDKLSALEH